MLPLVLAAWFQVRAVVDVPLSTSYDVAPSVAIGPQGPLVASSCSGGLRVGLLTLAPRPCEERPLLTTSYSIGRIMAGSRGAAVFWWEVAQDPDPGADLVVERVDARSGAPDRILFTTPGAGNLRAAALNDRDLFVWQSDTWSSGYQLWLAVVDDSPVPALSSLPTLLAVTQTNLLVGAAGSGSHFVVIQEPAKGNLLAWIITADGHLDRGPIDLGVPVSAAAYQSNVVGVRGGFLLLWPSSEGSDAVASLPISEEGRVGLQQSTRIPGFNAGTVEWMKAVSDGPGFYLAYEIALAGVNFPPRHDIYIVHFATVDSPPELIDHIERGTDYFGGLGAVRPEQFAFAAARGQLVAAWPRDDGRIWARQYDVGEERPEHPRRPGE